MMQALVMGASVSMAAANCFEFSEQQRADFVEGFVVESEFDDAVAPFPAQALAAEFFYREKIAAFFCHALDPAVTACLVYI